MTGTENDPGQLPGTYLNHRDEMSLADEQEARGEDSVPDTLEVRSDSVAILNGVVDRLRRPALVAAGVVLVAAVVTVGIARVLRGQSSAPAIST